LFECCCVTRTRIIYEQALQSISLESTQSSELSPARAPLKVAYIKAAGVLARYFYGQPSCRTLSVERAPST
jgi:hypothetical protein